MDSTQADYVQALRAPQPYLPDLVIVGGWAHRLFRFHEWASRTEFTPLTTDDTDVLAPLRLGDRGKSVHDLLTSGGFDVQLSGESPPTTKYYPRHGGSGFHVEFIAKRSGSGRRGDGKTDRVRVVSGVTVQMLPYVEMLHLSPWALNLTAEKGFPLNEGAIEVRVVNPVTYLAQKVLVFSRGDRSREKQAKDVLYIHDTLLLLSTRLGELEHAWGDLSSEIHSSWASALRKIRDKEFAGVTDRLRRAAIIAQASGRGDPPDADRIREVCRLGLGRVFR